MDGQVFINLGGLGVISGLVGLIYKSINDKVRDMSKTVVYKDTCEKVQERFCDDIKVVRQDIRDMRKEVKEGLDELKEEVKNGRG